MPLVRSIDILLDGNGQQDGFSVVTTRGGTHSITSADLTPAQKAMTPAQLETVANAFFAARLAPLGMFAACHLTSVVPLQGTMMVSNDPITGNWWAP